MIAKAQGDIDAARQHLSRALEADRFLSPLYADEARAALLALGE